MQVCPMEAQRLTRAESVTVMAALVPTAKMCPTDRRSWTTVATAPIPTTAPRLDTTWRARTAKACPTGVGSLISVDFAFSQTTRFSTKLARTVPVSSTGRSSLT